MNSTKLGLYLAKGVHHCTVKVKNDPHLSHLSHPATDSQIVTDLTFAAEPTPEPTPGWHCVPKV